MTDEEHAAWFAALPDEERAAELWLIFSFASNDTAGGIDDKFRDRKNAQ
jgi:hypothetical protein